MCIQLFMESPWSRKTVENCFYKMMMMICLVWKSICSSRISHMSSWRQWLFDMYSLINSLMTLNLCQLIFKSIDLFIWNLIDWVCRVVVTFLETSRIDLFWSMWWAFLSKSILLLFIGDWFVNINIIFVIIYFWGEGGQLYKYVMTCQTNSEGHNKVTLLCLHTHASLLWSVQYTWILVDFLHVCFSVSLREGGWETVWDSATLCDNAILCSAVYDCVYKTLQSSGLHFCVYVVCLLVSAAACVH